jgi:hypothetical protein
LFHWLDWMLDPFSLGALEVYPGHSEKRWADSVSRKAGSWMFVENFYNERVSMIAVFL